MKSLHTLVETLTSRPALVGAGVAVSAALAVSLLAATGDGDDESDGILHLEHPHALLGDLSPFTTNLSRLHEWITEQSLRFNGEPWRIRLPRGMKSMVIITKPELIDEISSQQFSNFPRGEHRITTVEDLMGRSLVTSDGAKWHHLRKIATKFFTASALRKCMVASVHRGVRQVYQEIDQHAETGTAVDLMALFHEFSLQVFSEAGLGLDLEFIGRSDGHPLEDAIERATVLISRRVRLPMWYWKLERWLNVGPERELAEALGELRGWLRTVVDESMRAVEKRQRTPRGSGEGESETKSIVELFMEQSDDENGLQAQDLVDFILTFVLGARNTTAAALGWFFLMLAKHPDVEQRIRDEMGAMLESEGLADPGEHDALLTANHVRRLVYLEATLKEVLRLYPSLPIIQKEAAMDTVLCGKYAVKKGEMMMIETYTMARLPSVWGPDAAEFRPERWIDPHTGGLVNEPSTKFNTFGSGPRMCIGMKLAMLELRVVTANLLKRYRFALAAPNDGAHVFSMELMLKDPLLVRATAVRSGT